MQQGQTFYGKPPNTGRDDLVESIAVALLTARTRQGWRVVIRDPLHYAQAIANDLLGAPAQPESKPEG